MRVPERRMSLDAARIPNVQSWLCQELETRGIDAMVYTRYILSILQQDSFDLELSRNEDQFLSLLKGGACSTSGGGGGNKRGKKVERRWSFNGEQLKKTAAVECLLSATDEDQGVIQDQGIISLVEETYRKLKEEELKDPSKDSPSNASTKTDSAGLVRSSSPKKKGSEGYYEAFPALSQKENNNSEGKPPCSISSSSKAGNGSSSSSSSNSVWSFNKTRGSISPLKHEPTTRPLQAAKRSLLAVGDDDKPDNYCYAAKAKRQPPRPYVYYKIGKDTRARAREKRRLKKHTSPTKPFTKCHSEEGMKITEDILNLLKVHPENVTIRHPTIRRVSLPSGDGDNEEKYLYTGPLDEIFPPKEPKLRLYERVNSNEMFASSEVLELITNDSDSVSRFLPFFVTKRRPRDLLKSDVEEARNLAELVNKSNNNLSPCAAEICSIDPKYLVETSDSSDSSLRNTPSLITAEEHLQWLTDKFGPDDALVESGAYSDQALTAGSSAIEDLLCHRPGIGGLGFTGVIGDRVGRRRVRGHSDCMESKLAEYNTQPPPIFAALKKIASFDSDYEIFSLQHAFSIFDEFEASKLHSSGFDVFEAGRVKFEFESTGSLDEPFPTQEIIRQENESSSDEVLVPSPFEFSSDSEVVVSQQDVPCLAEPPAPCCIEQPGHRSQTPESGLQVPQSADELQSPGALEIDRMSSPKFETREKEQVKLVDAVAEDLEVERELKRSEMTPPLAPETIEIDANGQVVPVTSSASKLLEMMTRDVWDDTQENSSAMETLSSEGEIVETDRSASNDAQVTDVMTSSDDVYPTIDDVVSSDSDSEEVPVCRVCHGYVCVCSETPIAPTLVQQESLRCDVVSHALRHSDVIRLRSQDSAASETASYVSMMDLIDLNSSPDNPSPDSPPEPKSADTYESQFETALEDPQEHLYFRFPTPKKQQLEYTIDEKARTSFEHETSVSSSSTSESGADYVLKDDEILLDLDSVLAELNIPQESLAYEEADDVFSHPSFDESSLDTLDPGAWDSAGAPRALFAEAPAVPLRTSEQEEIEKMNEELDTTVDSGVGHGELAIDESPHDLLWLFDLCNLHHLYTELGSLDDLTDTDPHTSEASVELADKDSMQNMLLQASAYLHLSESFLHETDNDLASALQALAHDTEYAPIFGHLNRLFHSQLDDDDELDLPRWLAESSKPLRRRSFSDIRELQDSLSAHGHMLRNEYLPRFQASDTSAFQDKIPPRLMRELPHSQSDSSLFMKIAPVIRIPAKNDDDEALECTEIFSPDTHFRPILTTPDEKKTYDILTKPDIYNHVYPSDMTQDYQVYNNPEAETNFVPKFRLVENQDKALQTDFEKRKRRRAYTEACIHTCRELLASYKNSSFSDSYTTNTSNSSTESSNSRETACLSFRRTVLPLSELCSMVVYQRDAALIGSERRRTLSTTSTDSAESAATFIEKDSDDLDLESLFSAALSLKESSMANTSDDNSSDMISCLTGLDLPVRNAPEMTCLPGLLSVNSGSAGGSSLSSVHALHGLLDADSFGDLPHWKHWSSGGDNTTSDKNSIWSGSGVTMTSSTSEDVDDWAAYMTQGDMVANESLAEYSQDYDVTMSAIEACDLPRCPPGDQAPFSAELEEQWLLQGFDQTTADVWDLRPKRRSRSGSLSNRPCTFFMEGSCRRSDCKFSHDLSHITCRFWLKGECFKGITCPFLHGYVKESPTPGSRLSPSDCRSPTPVNHKRKSPHTTTNTADQKPFPPSIKDQDDFPPISACIQPMTSSSASHRKLTHNHKRRSKSRSNSKDDT